MNLICVERIVEGGQSLVCFHHSLVFHPLVSWPQFDHLSLLGVSNWHRVLSSWHSSKVILSLLFWKVDVLVESVVSDWVILLKLSLIYLDGLQLIIIFDTDSAWIISLPLFLISKIKDWNSIQNSFGVIRSHVCVEHSWRILYELELVENVWLLVQGSCVHNALIVAERHRNIWVFLVNGIILPFLWLWLMWDQGFLRSFELYFSNWSVALSCQSTFAPGRFKEWLRVSVTEGVFLLFIFVLSPKNQVFVSRHIPVVYRLWYIHILQVSLFYPINHVYCWQLRHHFMIHLSTFSPLRSMLGLNLRFILL